MDSPSSVEFGGLQKPEVVTFKVTKWHRVLKNVLLQISNIFVLRLLLLFDVLLYQPFLVVVEVFEDKVLIIRVFCLLLLF